VPGGSDTATFTGTYVIQQADIDAGSFTNESAVTAAAGASGGHPVSDDGDDVTVTLLQVPSLLVANTGTWADGDADGFADVGELVNYVITVVNDGNVTLDEVALEDSLLGTLSTHSESGGTGTNGDDILNVGETWTFNASYAITQDDIDAGNVHNDATATAAGPQDQPASDSDDNDAGLPQNPSVSVVMTAELPEADADGIIDSPDDDIAYTITVENNGNVTLHNVQVDDTLVTALSGPSGDGDSDGELDVGETWTYTAVYDVQQSDIDNRGSVDGTADDNILNQVTVATDEAPDGTASADVDILYNPAMELTKTGVWVDANANGVAEEGEVIDFTFTIENTGNVTLHDIGVTDTDGDVIMFGSPIPSLAPGAIDDTTWSGTHTITGVDVDNGFYDNTAAANANEGANASDAELVMLPQGSGAAAMSGSEGIEKWDYIF
jgi:uncharacterized repeat protein (TIGR01451 family)